jgi:hypothetical protein
MLGYQRPFYAAHPSTLCLTAGRFDARQYATVKPCGMGANLTVPMNGKCARH